MGRVKTKTFWAIASLVLIWGLCWPIYKITLPYTPPLLFAGARSLIGGILLCILLIPQWKNIRWRENWRFYCISTLFNTFLFYGLQTVGLMYLPGGLFSVLVYFQTVLIGLFGWLWLGERMSPKKMIGLLIGFFGVLAVSSDAFKGQISTVGVMLALVTAVCWAIGVVYVKKEGRQVDAMWMVALQCLLGGIGLTGVGLGVEDFSSIVWNGTYVFGSLYGSILGVPLAFIIYYKLVNAGEATKVASFTFLVPLIAVLIGTVFLGEPFTYSLLAGLVLIVTSIYLVVRPEKGSSVVLKEDAVIKGLEGR